MSFLAILETLNFEFWYIWHLVNLGFKSCSNLLESKFRTYRIDKNNIFGLFEFAKIWFHVKFSSLKIIKFQQSQVLTSHFESF